jgi:hypothetical protein
MIAHAPAGVELPSFRGLPDDRCQSDHWGYATKGPFRVRWGPPIIAGCWTPPRAPLPRAVGPALLASCVSA